MHAADLREEPRKRAAALQQQARPAARILLWFLAAALPLVGLASLLLRSELDPHFENYRAHGSRASPRRAGC